MTTSGLILSIGTICLFQAMYYLPISIVSVIMTLRGIVILVFGLFLGKDKASLMTSLLIFLSFFGAIMIIKPSLIFSSASDSDKSKRIFLLKKNYFVEKKINLKFKRNCE